VISTPVPRALFSPPSSVLRSGPMNRNEQSGIALGRIAALLRSLLLLAA
jgi:hypothetical protein